MHDREACTFNYKVYAYLRGLVLEVGGEKEEHDYFQSYLPLNCLNYYKEQVLLVNFFKC